MKTIIKWLKKPKYAVPAVLLLICLGIGGTMAWFTDIEAAINRITIGHNEIEIVETIKGLEKEKVGVANTGSIPVYVRLRVDIPSEITYLDNAGNIQTIEVIVEPTDSEQANWHYESNDGYWYYRPSIPKGATKYLYDSIKVEVNNPAAGEMERIKDMLDIVIYSESIQSEGLPEYIKTSLEAFEYMATLTDSQ